MKKLGNYLVAVIILVGTISLCLQIYRLKQKIQTLSDSPTKQVTDTVYRTHYKPVKDYKLIQVPTKLIFYGDPDSTHLASRDHSKDSLIQVLINRNKITLTFKDTQDPDSLITSRVFDVDLDSYKYNWVGGKLTKEKDFKLKLDPYIYGKYRVFNHMTDLGMGLSFKTKSFNYKLGINSFYYPQLQKDLGFDLELHLEYNF